MTSFIWYLLETSICLLVMGGFYFLFIRQLTFHTLKRFFILGVLVYSLFIPLIEFPDIIPAQSQIQQMGMMVEEWELQFQEAVEIAPFNSQKFRDSSYSPNTFNESWGTLILLVYFIGVIIGLIRLGRSIRDIWRLIKTYKLSYQENYWLVETDLPHSFSFASALFVAKAHLLLPEKERKQIFRHELTHIHQKHSWDLLFVEMLGIFFWFHPLIPFLKRELKQVHECLADQEVLKYHSPSEYGKLLLKLAIQKQALPLTLIHPFAYVSLKSRIIMMNNQNSSKWKLLLLFPAFMMLSALWVLLSPSLSQIKAEVRPIIDQQIIPSQTQEDITPNTWPVDGGKLISGFGMRVNPFTKEKQLHTGIDISAHIGTTVFAAGEGKVMETGFDKKKGKYLVLKHGETYQTHYFHLAKIMVEAGDEVSPAQQIAQTGNTGLSKGPHLHFEIWKDGQSVNPLPYIQSDIQTRSISDEGPTGAPLKEMEIYSGFGMRTHPVTKAKKHHRGVDFKAATGTPIYATADGTVRLSGNQTNGYGIHIVIQHADSYETLYAHLSKTSVNKNDQVKKGDLIGHTGNSGLSQKPHLHYEIKKDGKPVNPADYLP